MSNTIITGGSGFLATEILKKFKNKKNIYLISRKKIKINKNLNNIVCDLRNKSNTIKILKKINPSTVYHFAWKGIPKFNKKNFLDFAHSLSEKHKLEWIRTNRSFWRQKLSSSPLGNAVDLMRHIELTLANLYAAKISSLDRTASM